MKSNPEGRSDPFLGSGLSVDRIDREIDRDRVPDPVEIESLSHSYGTGQSSRLVLSDVNLRLRPGELVILTGPSGSGKTTLLTLIGGLRQVQSGALRVLGRNLAGLTESELVSFRRNVGFIFQHHNLFESLTAFQNVRMALELKPMTEEELNKRATQVLQRVGLEKQIDQLPKTLSGGQGQRVAIARALANKPKLILADEPTASLDRVSGEKVLELLHELTTDGDPSTVILVTHDQRLIDNADRIVNLVDGKISSNVIVQQAVQICQFLNRCEIFDELELDVLTEIAETMEMEHFPKGSTIIRQGDEGDRFFLIFEGSVDVLRDHDKVATLKGGDFFGEAALVTGEPRNATIVCSRPVSVCSLSKDEFQAVLKRSTNFRDHVRRILFQRR
jgi:putative ABC transport system ATP-binding protein